MPQSSEDLYILSQVLVGGEDFDGAEKTARRALLEFPRSQGFHYILGEVALKRTKYAEAAYEYLYEFYRAGPASPTGKRSIERVREILEGARGTDIDEVRNVLDAMALTVSDPKGAQARIAKLQSMRGDRLALLVLAAEAHTRAGDRAKAQSVYREILRRDSYFIPAYVQLAALVRKDQPKEADRLMKTAKEKDPGNWQLQIPNQPAPKDP